MIWNSIASVVTEAIYTFLFDGTKFHRRHLFFFFFFLAFSFAMSVDIC